MYSTSGMRGRGVPGVVGRGIAGWVSGGYLGGLYRYPPDTIPGTHIELDTASEPYLRPNEANSSGFYEVSQIRITNGSQNDLRMTSE